MGGPLHQQVQLKHMPCTVLYSSSTSYSSGRINLAPNYSVTFFKYVEVPKETARNLWAHFIFHRTSETGLGILAGRFHLGFYGVMLQYHSRPQKSWHKCPGICAGIRIYVNMQTLFQLFYFALPSASTSLCVVFKCVIRFTAEFFSGHFGNLSHMNQAVARY